MKKTFVILTIVLAILAAPVFAEVTASGEVDFEWAFNADDYSEKVDSNDMVIDLGGTVGDYTTISAEFEGEYAEDDGQIDGVDADGEDITANVVLNDATLTQDITGALGIESPVSVALTFGVKGIGDDPVNYNEVAAYNFASDGELSPGTIMTKASLGIDTFTVDLSIWEDENFGIEVYGRAADAADVSVYYFSGDAVAMEYGEMTAFEDKYVFGINGATDVLMEGLVVGAGMEMYGFKKIGDVSSFMYYGVSAAYTMDALEAGVSMGGEYIDIDDFEAAEHMKIAANVTYGVNEMVDVFACVGTLVDPGEEDAGDVIFYEAGAALGIDNVTYTAGYTLESDWNAYDAGYTDDDGERAGNFFIKVGASF